MKAHPSMLAIALLTGALVNRPRRPLDATSGKGTGIVGFNVKMAVDAKHHLMVVHDVTNSGSDRSQLVSWQGMHHDLRTRSRR